MKLKDASNSAALKSNTSMRHQFTTVTNEMKKVKDQLEGKDELMDK